MEANPKSQPCIYGSRLRIVGLSIKIEQNELHSLGQIRNIKHKHQISQ